MFGIKILLEVAVVLLICYGIIHEEDLVEFESVVAWCIKNPGKVKANVKKYIKESKA